MNSQISSTPQAGWNNKPIWALVALAAIAISVVAVGAGNSQVQPPTQPTGNESTPAALAQSPATVSQPDPPAVSWPKGYRGVGAALQAFGQNAKTLEAVGSADNVTNGMTVNGHPVTSYQWTKVDQSREPQAWDSIVAYVNQAAHKVMSVDVGIMAINRSDGVETISVSQVANLLHLSVQPVVYEGDSILSADYKLADGNHVIIVSIPTAPATVSKTKTDFDTGQQSTSFTVVPGFLDRTKVTRIYQGPPTANGQPAARFSDYNQRKIM